MSRPVSKNPKSVMVQFRCTESDYILICRAAKRLGMSVSSYLRGQGKSAALLILANEHKKPFDCEDVKEPDGYFER